MGNLVQKFNVLDDIKLHHRLLLLGLCGVTCAYGFESTAILLIFAGKIGFPLAVAVCGITVNRNQIFNMIIYTTFLILVGTVYFLFNRIQLDFLITKNFHPTLIDFILAVGLGAALSFFWNHPIRINIIILSAALASLLPACILTGYYIATGQFYASTLSLALYFEYVFGIIIGSFLSKIIYEHN
jgi:hypothetical protein